MDTTRMIRTSVTDLFGIKYPILLAGMNVAAGPQLAAAVTNAGGLGILGGMHTSAVLLKEQINELKSYLHDKAAPFGVDLLLPQVGGNARKTNYDYTKGHLDDLIDVIIASGARVFVSAIGLPPKEIIERLHKNGILYMNMVGHPKHVQKCLNMGVDLICAQGGEGGGHTGEIPTTVLTPACVNICNNYKSPLTGKTVPVVAAGGIHSGRMLAASLMMGAQAVWVGTRFVLSKEAGASKAHKESIRTAGFDDTVRTTIYTGRPLRLRVNNYINTWETRRRKEAEELLSQGIVPYEADLERDVSDLHPHSGSNQLDIDEQLESSTPYLMGQCAALIDEEKSAKEIIDEFVADAIKAMSQGVQILTKL
ncbi:Nitronate monooxygenase-domain-containing protein [Biscogniauxia marginata]|nr:Nitronate monooxygenase-domain-containing protein [Biscogniauxia marginata]